MSEYLINRIINDAEEEAKKIIADAKRVAKGNIDYAKKNSIDLIISAEKTAGKRKEREAEITQSTKSVADKIQILRERTRIVDEVFDQAFDEINFKWRVEVEPKYEIRLTKECLKMTLREEIEPDVVRLIYGEPS